MRGHARGEKANARMVTNAMLGLFKSNFNTRQEFLSSIGRSILTD